MPEFRPPQNYHHYHHHHLPVRPQVAKLQWLPSPCDSDTGAVRAERPGCLPAGGDARAAMGPEARRGSLLVTTEPARCGARRRSWARRCWRSAGRGRRRLGWATLLVVVTHW